MYFLSRNPLRPHSYQDILAVKSIFISKIFWIGLLIRLIIILCSLSNVQFHLFIPFLSFEPSLLLDPWTSFISLPSNLSDSFPYGIVTYAYYKIFISIPSLIAIILPIFNTVSLQYIFFNLGTIILDVATLISIVFLLPNSRSFTSRILLLYWLSPIIIYALYWHGQIDVLPIFSLLLSLVCLQYWRFFWSGLFISLAVSSKFSMVICLPFYFIFILKDSFYREHFKSILVGFIPTLTLLFCFHALFSPGFQLMVLGTPVALKIFDLSILFNLEYSLIRFYIVPFSYLFLIYYFCCIERINWDLFLCFSTLSLYTLVIFVFPSPGWFIWIVPFAVIYIIGAEGFSSKLYWLSSFQYLLFFSTSYYFDNSEVNSSLLLIHNLLFTVMQALMIMQMISIYQYGIRKNKFYRSFPTPFLLTAASTNDAVAKEFTDSFHRLMSSQRPYSVDIQHYYKYKSSFYNIDSTKLTQILNKNHVYNYDMSRFLNDLYRIKSLLLPSTTRINSNTQVVKSQTLKRVKFATSCIPISFSSNIFINNISDFNLVIIDQIGMNNLNQDEITCIDLADIIFYLRLASPHHSCDTNSPKKIKLTAILSNFYHQDIIQKKLIAICGINVDITYLRDNKSIEMNFDGECSKEDLILVLRSILPLAGNLVSDITALQSGYQGIMQLLMITSIASKYSLSSSHTLA